MCTVKNYLLKCFTKKLTFYRKISKTMNKQDQILKTYNIYTIQFYIVTKVYIAWVNIPFDIPSNTKSKLVHQISLTKPATV